MHFADVDYDILFYPTIIAICDDLLWNFAENYAVRQAGDYYLISVIWYRRHPFSVNIDISTTLMMFILFCLVFRIRCTVRYTMAYDTLYTLYAVVTPSRKLLHCTEGRSRNYFHCIVRRFWINHVSKNVWYWQAGFIGYHSRFTRFVI